MTSITANATFHGHDLRDISVINPGAWFGKTWLVEIGGSYSSFYLIVEADSISDAIDELADSEQHAHHVVVDPADLGDYPEDNRYYSGCGKVLNLDHLMVHGHEGTKQPFPCSYHGDGLPPEGMNPTDFRWEDMEV